MSLTERISQWWARVRLLVILLLTVLGALALVAWRRYQGYRQASRARQAQMLRASQSTYDAADRLEVERGRLEARARDHAIAAKAARDRADRIAGQVERNGHPGLADFIREWNGA